MTCVCDSMDLFKGGCRCGAVVPYGTEPQVLQGASAKIIDKQTGETIHEISKDDTYTYKFIIVRTPQALLDILTGKATPSTIEARCLKNAEGMPEGVWTIHGWCRYSDGSVKFDGTSPRSGCRINDLVTKEACWEPA